MKKVDELLRKATEAHQKKKETMDGICSISCSFIGTKDGEGSIEIVIKDNAAGNGDRDYKVFDQRGQILYERDAFGAVCGKLEAVDDYIKNIAEFRLEAF